MVPTGKGKRPRVRRSPDDYFASQTGIVADTLLALRSFIKATLPTATEDFKWGAPVYSNPDGYPLCYLLAVRDHVNLGFLSGARLKDPRGMLEGSGKNGRHVKIFGTAGIRKTALRQLLRDAAGVARRQAKEGRPPGCSNHRSR